MAGIKPMSKARKLESKEALFRSRKRVLKYLVMSYLKQEGYFHTAEAFETEADVTSEYQVCDNIDLDIILQDYCSYYLIKFNKQPQFCKKVEDPSPPRRPPNRKPAPKVEKVEECEQEADLHGMLEVRQILQNQTDNTIPAIERKPLAHFISNAPADKRQMVEMLYQEIIRPSTVCWEDIKGLTEAKSLLMESVVYPVRYPHVFTGLLSPWRGVLLHGAPGTGKTMLARAVADQSRCTFFNVTCSTIVNKWRGDSEKIVKVLFDMATYYSPSIIFIDELETLASERSSPGEHEASRRLKSQLLTELDGIGHRDGIVFLLANSNMPWEIDPAMLRRLEKRIHIPLPDFKTRQELFETFLNSKNLEMYPMVDFKEFAAKTEGYSGSEIKLICKEALMSGVRKILPSIAARNLDPARKDRIELSDVLTAIEKTKPVSRNLAKRHQQWQAEMGCS